MTPVADLVRSVSSNHGVDWHGLVGALLGELTVPLGVNDVGVLRVMAVNETAMREVEARADSLMGAWNTAASLRGEREATSLQCWVREGLRPPATERGGRVERPSPREIPVGLRADAEALTGPMGNASVREALVEMRAKSLATRKDDEQGDV